MITKEKSKDIKVICTDVDGCLTNNTYLVGRDGNISRAFHAMDWYALDNLNKKKIPVLMISQSIDLCIDIWISHMPFKQNIEVLRGGRK